MTNFFKEYQEVFPIVCKLLEEEAKARDCDKYLCGSIWEKQLDNMQLDVEDAVEYLKKGILTSPESITRSRRKAQEKYSDLRGEMYARRHQLEKQVQSEINQLTFYDLPGVTWLK